MKNQRMFGIAAVIPALVIASQARAVVVTQAETKLHLKTATFDYPNSGQTDVKDATRSAAPDQYEILSKSSSSGPNSFASIAAVAGYNYTSFDHGVVKLDLAASNCYDGKLPRNDLPITGFSLNLSSTNGGSYDPFWTYTFTPTVDANLTLSTIGSYNVQNGDTIQSVLVASIFYGTTIYLYDGDMSLFPLTAGQQYSLLLQTRISNYVNDRDPAVDYSKLAAMRVTFDITAAGTTTSNPNPDPPGSSVPEPASWALMLAGFGLTGASLRRRRRCAQELGSA